MKTLSPEELEAEQKARCRIFLNIIGDMLELDKLDPKGLREIFETCILYWQSRKAAK